MSTKTLRVVAHLKSKPDKIQETRDALVDLIELTRAEDGCIVYELPCHPLATPKPLTPADAHRMAQEYFDQWLHSVDVWIERAKTAPHFNGADD